MMMGLVSSSSSSSSSAAAAALLVAASILGQLVVPAAGQGCASTCPPLDDIGKPIPSLCVNSTVPPSYLSRPHDVCHPLPAATNAPATPSRFALEELAADGRTVVVLANHYVGCNAGRRESGVFAHVAQRYHDLYNTNTNSAKNQNDHRRIVFVTSLKGGSACERWADIYQEDAGRLYPNSTVRPSEMPWTVEDTSYALRDDFFTTPFGHPSYVVLAPARLGGGGEGDEVAGGGGLFNPTADGGEPMSSGGGGMVVRNKFVGPCCGFVRYSDCQPETARELDGMLSDAIDAIMEEMEEQADDAPTVDVPESESTVPDTDTDTNTATDTDAEPEVETSTPLATNATEPEEEDCIVGEFSEWSPCSVDCGPTDGMQFRWRTVVDNRPALAFEATVTDEGEAIVGPEVVVQRESCPSPVEVRECRPTGEEGGDNILLPSSVGSGNLDTARSSLCLPVCVPEFNGAKVVEVASGFESPRDVAFHPSPGLHLGERSEGRDFNPTVGEEAWVANGANHSVSIVAALGSDEHQTTFSRRDRGYYHYMVNVTALSFNMVANSGRDAAKDSYEYFAVCNDNNNDYMKMKEVRAWRNACMLVRIDLPRFFFTS